MSGIDRCEWNNWKYRSFNFQEHWRYILFQLGCLLPKKLCSTKNRKSDTVKIDESRRKIGLKSRRKIAKKSMQKSCRKTWYIWKYYKASVEKYLNTEHAHHALTEPFDKRFFFAFQFIDLISETTLKELRLKKLNFDWRTTSTEELRLVKSASAEEDLHYSKKNTNERTFTSILSFAITNERTSTIIRLWLEHDTNNLGAGHR